MKNTLDPGLSTLSKTAIILTVFGMLIGFGAADLGPKKVSPEYKDGNEDLEVSSASDLRSAVQNPENEVIQLTEDVSLDKKLRISQDTVVFGSGELNLNGNFIHLDGQKTGASEVDVVLEGLKIRNDAEPSNDADIVVQRLGQESLDTVNLTLRNNDFNTPNKVVSTYRDGLNGGEYVFEGNTVTVDAESPNSWTALHIDNHQGDIDISNNEFDVNYNAISFGNTFNKVTIENNHFTGKRGINFGNSQKGSGTYEVEVKENIFTNLGAEAVRVEGMTQYGETNADIQSISISENRFEDNKLDIGNYHSEGETLKATHNLGDSPQGLEIDGSIEWRPYFPTEQALENSNAFESYDAFLSSFDTDTNSQRSTSEIRSIAEQVAGESMTQAEVQSIVQSEVEGFVSENELESELSDREDTIEEQEETIEEQQERINELESEVDQLSNQMNQTLEVLEESGQAEVESGPTGSFTVTNPEDGAQGGGIGDFFSGIFG